jgi:hypothetical protein
LRDGSEHSGENRPEFGQALLACSMAAVFRTRAKKFLIEARRNLNTVVLIFNPYQTSRILFVGSANPINVQALEWILGAVFPHIQKKRADSELGRVDKIVDA